MSFRRNTDTSLPASHTAELTFILPPDFSGGGVGNVPGILMKSNEQARGTPLAGLAVKVTDGFFLVGLSNVDADRARNLQLLKERSWFDVPLVYINQRRAIIAIEKGVPGERAFNEAFAAWGEYPTATTVQPEPATPKDGGLSGSGLLARRTRLMRRPPTGRCRPSSRACWVPVARHQARRFGRQALLLPRHGRSVRHQRRGHAVLRQSENRRWSVHRPKELTASHEQPRCQAIQKVALFRSQVSPPIIKQEPKQMPDLIDDGTWREAALARMSEAFPTNRGLWPMYRLMAGAHRYAIDTRRLHGGLSRADKRIATSIQRRRSKGRRFSAARARRLCRPLDCDRRAAALRRGPASWPNQRHGCRKHKGPHDWPNAALAGDADHGIYTDQRDVQAATWRSLGFVWTPTMTIGSGLPGASAARRAAEGPPRRPRQPGTTPPSSTAPCTTLATRAGAAPAASTVTGENYDQPTPLITNFPIPFMISSPSCSIRSKA